MEDNKLIEKQIFDKFKKLGFEQCIYDIVYQIVNCHLMRF